MQYVTWAFFVMENFNNISLRFTFFICVNFQHGCLGDDSFCSAVVPVIYDVTVKLEGIKPCCSHYHDCFGPRYVSGYRKLHSVKIKTNPLRTERF